MLNIEYAPYEQETTAYECLEELDYVQLGMSEDLTRGYRLTDGTIFLPVQADEFLMSIEKPNWLEILKANKPKNGSLVLVIEESIFPLASPVDYPERAAAIVALMKDPSIHFVMLEDSADTSEIICAFAREALEQKLEEEISPDPAPIPYRRSKVPPYEVKTLSASGSARASLSAAKNGLVDGSIETGGSAEPSPRITPSMLFWLKWLNTGGEIKRTAVSDPQALRCTKRITYAMTEKLEESGLVKWGPLEASGQHRIRRCSLLLTEKGILAIEAAKPSGSDMTP